MELHEIIAAARGDAPADLVLKNARLVNVFSGEIHETDVVVKGTRVAALGSGYDDAAQVIDLEGRYVCPGLIDAHVHVESSLCTPQEFARAVLSHGVTSVVTDPHEIANVFGLEGIQYMLQEARHGPLSMFVMAPSCVPSTSMETTGAHLEADDLTGLRENQWVLGLAEVMNYPGVVSGDEAVLSKIRAWDGCAVDGHAPGLEGKPLNAYVAAGVRSDHECSTPEELVEKVRLGMTIFLREATGTKDLLALLPGLTPGNAQRLCLCTDDRHPAELIDEGSIDHLVRLSVAQGVPLLTAIQMATINPAEHFGLRDRGALTPGRRADMVVFSDPDDFRAELVFRGGQLVAQNGELLVERGAVDRPRQRLLRSSMNVRRDTLDFKIPAGDGRARVIGCTPGSLLSEHLLEEVPTRDGEAVADPARDILKMAVVERHLASGSVGKGFIRGIGLARGAIASTVAHDHHNLVLVGADDVSMRTAAEAAIDMGGGLAVAEGERVLARLPLPIAGLMSDRPMDEVRAQMDQLIAAARELGSPLHDPFMAICFMALPVVPKLKLTDQGLVDVERFEVVPLFTS